jgi:hypothetical protein
VSGGPTNSSQLACATEASISGSTGPPISETSAAGIAARRPCHPSTSGAWHALLTSKPIWFDPAPHIADRKTLDVDIDPVRPSVTSSTPRCCRARPLAPTPRVVVRLPGPADRWVVRSAADRPGSPPAARTAAQNIWPLTSRVCIRQASNSGRDRTTRANARLPTCPGRPIPGCGVDLPGHNNRPGHGRAAGTLGGKSAPDQSPRARGWCTPRVRSTSQRQEGAAVGWARGARTHNPRIKSVHDHAAIALYLRLCQHRPHHRTCDGTPVHAISRHERCHGQRACASSE